jgi:hypothetical protein
MRVTSVTETAVGVTSLREIEVCDRIPMEVFQAAVRMVEAAEADPFDTSKLAQAALAVRLCADRRMNSVWNVVFSLGPKGALKYPANDMALNDYAYCVDVFIRRDRALKTIGCPSLEADHSLNHALLAAANVLSKNRAKELGDLLPQEKQQLAALQLFQWALTAAQNASVVTRKELRAEVRHARRFLDLVSQIGRDKPTANIDLVRLEYQRDLATLYCVGDSQNVNVVERARGNRRFRGFALRMTEVTKALFNTPLYGGVATLANIVFDRTDLREHYIRDLVKERKSGLKAQRRDVKPKLRRRA